MAEILGKTWSLCPVCLSKIPAVRVAEDNNVYLEKQCREHGKFKVLVWRDADYYKSLNRLDSKRNGSPIRHTGPKNGCPRDCGLCPQHEQDTCLAIMEVTDRCNLKCKACFASADDDHRYEPSLDDIRRMYALLLKGSKPVCVQISGGEPTVRSDLPEIVSLGKRMGIDYIEVNTNGINLAKDIDSLRELKAAGADSLYLSFDGVTPEVYREICGEDILDLKVKALENCAKVGMGVILVPRVIKFVNHQQIGDIIEFAKKWIPTVKGVHFQPLSYFGRHPGEPSDDDRVTIPDLLSAIEVQTGGEIKVDNFIPTCCSEIHCDTRCLAVLMENGRLFPLTSCKDSVPSVGVDIPKRIRESVADLWKLPQMTEAPCSPGGAPCKCQSGSWMEIVQRATDNYLTISAMAFQDAWNIDLDRVSKCCIHVVTPDERLIPFCAFNVTATDGKTLYRNQVLSKRSG